jgi:hypothetical protein
MGRSLATVPPKLWVKETLLNYRACLRSVSKQQDLSTYVESCLLHMLSVTKSLCCLNSGNVVMVMGN